MPKGEPRVLRVSCYGYREPASLIIYDQTEEVSKKAQARHTVARKSKSASPEQQPACLAGILPPPISNDDRALSHLFTYYVGTGEGRGMFWYVPDLLRTSPSPALQATMKALGMASMSRMQTMPDLRRPAAEEYSKALRATNDALRDPVLAKSDATLAAVAALGTYVVRVHEMTMMHGWMNHNQGATKLLELRGEEQLDSELGMELFTVVRLLNVLSNALFRYSMHHSPMIAELSKMAEVKRDANTRPIETFYELVVRLNDLAIQIDKDGKSAENLGPLIGEALHLDADLKLWSMFLGRAWHSTVIDTPPLPELHVDKNVYTPIRGERYHMYPSLGIASIWNFYRHTRIMLNEMIRSISLRCVEFQRTSEWQQVVSQSATVIDQLVDDVCGGVVFHFISGAPGLGATLRLQWPLFIAALCTDRKSAKYAWILQNLDIIANTTGFQQALSFSQRLRDGSTKGIIPGS
ncbi:hypothetical protein BDW59DRAFT_158269 [Aspergillus cavernicola]|uniref:C6 finger domain protein n=1 Tax=Aspergillus cavernicola TaxID=176166 RepID=A0ABR4ISU9_9EURO